MLGGHGVIYWIILGLIAGAIASRIVERRGAGIVLDIIIGIVGAVIGGYIGEALHLGGLHGYGYIWSLFLAVVGAVVVLLGYRALSRR